MRTVVGPLFRTHAGEVLTEKELRGRTTQQRWFAGTFLDWCAAKGFIRDTTPIVLGQHVCAGADLTDPGVARNLLIADELYGD